VDKDIQFGLATDLDGTLLRPDLTVSAQTRQGLAAAIGRGIGIVFVTGRPPRWMKPVVDATGHVGIAICANGSVTVDLQTDQITRTHAIPLDVVSEVRRHVQELLGPDTRFGIEYAEPGPLTDSGFAHERSFIPAVATGAVIHDFRKPWSGPAPVKLLARSPGFGSHLGDPNDHESDFHSRADELLAQANETLGELVTVTQSHRTELLLEMGPLGVSKASGLAEMADAWHLGPVDFSAVGDMPNDIPMLAWAGNSYAVASAHPTVIAAADQVIPDPEHDGVLQLLNRL
jgi:hydroxymethylpyrimidine pyrophosphatase-like HAD family hydrolase